ncbi:hypothetical protein TSOC_005418 [Tetrabaena socialis]|uniref:Uncharacterized protein n=1 Tax=Tetrabaena socialis TaxID=47790 RepID=A0A2J8A6A9_9CHLO|nr:hypothetical protein TSOC_005418 [Tetrabaena socialis]|eukprot:PNH08059.1 hypothetical protein TSOC_005418 [Tetrabaena socialis]
MSRRLSGQHLLCALSSLYWILACANSDTFENPGLNGTLPDVNSLFARKLELYRASLPEQLQQRVTATTLAQQLAPTLRFIYMDAWLRVLEYGFIVPELGMLFDGEAAQLFGNITYIDERGAELSFETSLHLLLATLNSFDPTRFTTLLTAYPVCRRAVTALLLERYLRTGGFTATEGLLVVNISKRLFQMHKRAAVTKRIVEFMHVSKSGGTSFCQLGRMNGCKSESFGLRENCMITYFRDAPRWTVPGALGKLSEERGDPWYNFYSNELVMHDHNRSWTGVHPCREFLNVVIFREPELRIVSHLQNILKEYVNHYNTSFWDAFDPTSPEQWRTLAVPVLDNYVIRSLLGGTAYNMPFGSVNATHLLAAKIITLQFEVLLSLTPQTSELTRDIFGMGLGWHFDLRHLHARSTRNRTVHSFAPAVMELVHAGRQLDQELYEFALVLQLLDALAFGVAHDVAGVGVGGTVAVVTPATQLEVAPGGSLETRRELSAQARPGGGKRRRAVCGYVGIKRKLGVKPPPPPPAAPALEMVLGVAGTGLQIEGLGATTIAGGRWFNGVFYRNASAAEELALAAARVAAQAAAQAVAAVEATAALVAAASGAQQVDESRQV